MVEAVNKSTALKCQQIWKNAENNAKIQLNVDKNMSVRKLNTLMFKKFKDQRVEN